MRSSLAVLQGSCLLVLPKTPAQLSCSWCKGLSLSTSCRPGNLKDQLLLHGLTLDFLVQQTKTPQEALDDEDAAMDFDLLDSDAEKKVGQKRPRRRVIVETKDANGRAYSAAEIRRMKR